MFGRLLSSLRTARPAGAFSSALPSAAFSSTSSALIRQSMALPVNFLRASSSPVLARSLPWSSLISTAIRSFASVAEVESARSAALGIHLSNIRDNPGARQQITRVGRGPGSGRGKTAGKGMKGQKKRSGGGVPLGFEGGQSPLHLRIPKRGPKNPAKKPLVPLNLDRLQYWISTGRIDPEKPITMKVLQDSGCATRIKHGVKLLARGGTLLEAKVDLEVTRASQTAIEAVEARGGKVTTRYFDRLGLRLLLHPEKFDPMKIPRFALPRTKEDRDYYSKWEKRGYLAKPAEQPAAAAAAAAVSA